MRSIASMVLLALGLSSCHGEVGRAAPPIEALLRCDVAESDRSGPEFACAIGPWQIIAQGSEIDQVVRLLVGERAIAEIAEHQFAIVPGKSIAVIGDLFGPAHDGLAILFQTRGAHCCVWLVVAEPGPDADSHRYFLGNEPGVLEFDAVRDLFRRDPDGTVGFFVVESRTSDTEAFREPRAVRMRWSADAKRFEPDLLPESTRWDVVERAEDRSYRVVSRADPRAVVELLIAGGEPRILEWSLAPRNPGIGMLTYDAGTAGTSAFYRITRRALIDRSTGALIRDLPLRIDAIGNAPPTDQPRWTWGDGYVLHEDSPGEEPLRIEFRVPARSSDEDVAHWEMLQAWKSSDGDYGARKKFRQARFTSGRGSVHAD